MGYMHIQAEQAATLASDITVAWLAGILEGEGCFEYQCSPGIKLGMTDRDIVERVSLALGRNRVRGPYQYHGNKKPVFYTEIWGSSAIAWMRRLLPLMGERRSAKITAHIARWEVAPTKGHKLGSGMTALCHPEKPHYAHRKCRECYRRDRYQRGLGR
jgi:hypothetical protein